MADETTQPVTDDNFAKEAVSYSNKFLLIFAASCVGVCFIYIFCITFITIPAANQRYADVCLGFLLGTLMSTVIQFYYGSSTSAKEKDQALQKLTTDYGTAMDKLKAVKDLASTLTETADTTTITTPTSTATTTATTAVTTTETK